MHNTGKGLGLYMIKVQVEAMGGTVSIRSKPNEGFECFITLKAIGREEFESADKMKAIISN